MGLQTETGYPRQGVVNFPMINLRDELLRLEGVPARQATLEASRLRLRPILMTSFAFIFGVVPLVIATGAGAELRRSLGLAVFAGMIGVTLFGIFLTPVFFYVLQWFGPGSHPRPDPDAPTPETGIQARPAGH
jgi:multidrug efflux pump